MVLTNSDYSSDSNFLPRDNVVFEVLHDACTRAMLEEAGQCGTVIEFMDNTTGSKNEKQGKGGKETPTPQCVGRRPRHEGFNFTDFIVRGRSQAPNGLRSKFTG